MEPAEGTLRLRIIWGKYQVTKIEKGLIGIRVTITLPGSVSMTGDLPPGADVLVGDWITLYGEVPYKGIENAIPGVTSK